MAVTEEFLDSISFDIAKQKYYNANKVDAKMAEIKTALRELIEENERLKAEAASVGEMKNHAAQLMLSAQEQAARTTRRKRPRRSSKKPAARRAAWWRQSACSRPARDCPRRRWRLSTR